MSELDTWKTLVSQVEQGNLKLRIDREHFDAAIKALQNYVDEIDLVASDVEVVSAVTGLGGFDMGVQLAKKFAVKGGGDESIKQRLKELQDEAKAIQDALRKAALAYAETDDELRKQFEGIKP